MSQRKEKDESDVGSKNEVDPSVLLMERRKDALHTAGSALLDSEPLIQAVVFVGQYIRVPQAGKCDFIVVAQPQAHYTPDEYEARVWPIIRDSHSEERIEWPMSLECLDVIKTAREIDYMQIPDGRQYGMYRVDREGIADIPPQSGSR